MHLNDLLKPQEVDPAKTMVLRHQPQEPLLRKALPSIAGERRSVFNSYQAYQSTPVEKSILSRKGGWVASFIAYGTAKAVFVGLYSIDGHTLESEETYWTHHENVELGKFGIEFKLTHDPLGRARLHLTPLDTLSDWSGKLVVGWPPPSIAWYRDASTNVMPVLAIREESAFAVSMPVWDQLECAWGELAVLPLSWKAALAQWRGVYSIFDVSDSKRYVGSAYGSSNILGRWMGYASSGHGGNKLLKERDPTNFRFTILQRVSPDMDAEEVIRLEASWKLRLQTRSPSGLNEN